MTRTEKYGRRQQEIVGVAAELFARRGFQATTMDELSDATGLQSGGLYHYIGSKQRLLFQIFGQLMDPLLEAAAAIEARDQDAEAKLRALVHAWVAHIETHLDHMSVFAQERHAIEREPEWQDARASRDARTARRRWSRPPAGGGRSARGARGMSVACSSRVCNGRSV